MTAYLCTVKFGFSPYRPTMYIVKDVATTELAEEKAREFSRSDHPDRIVTSVIAMLLSRSIRVDLIESLAAIDKDENQTGRPNLGGLNPLDRYRTISRNISADNVYDFPAIRNACLGNAR